MNEKNSVSLNDNNERHEADEVLLLLVFDPNVFGVKREKEYEEVYITLSKSSTNNQWWLGNETNDDLTGADILSKILIFRRNYFISIGLQIAHDVDGITGHSDFSFKTRNIFVTEETFVDSFVIFSKIGRHIKSTRYISVFFYEFAHRNPK